MKEVKIIKPFHDCDDFAVVYLAGSVHSFEDARANKIVALGLAVLNTPDSYIPKPRKRKPKQPIE